MTPHSSVKSRIWASRSGTPASRALVIAACHTAPWDLLRPTFEASFYAPRLLTSDDSRARRSRGVQVEWLDDEAARKYRNFVRNKSAPTGWVGGTQLELKSQAIGRTFVVTLLRPIESA